MRVILPLATLYEYDPTIFDSIYIKGIDTTDFIEYFILSYGDMTPIYQSIPLLKRNIALTSVALKWSIDKLYHLTELEYNPLYDFEKNIEVTNHRNKTYQKGTTTNESSFQRGTISTNSDFKKGDFKSDSSFQKGTISVSNEASDKTTHNVSAFNATDLQVANNDISDSSKNVTESHGADTTLTSASYGIDTAHNTEIHDADTSVETVKNDVDSTDETNTNTSYWNGATGNVTKQTLIKDEHDVAMLNYIDDVCKLYAERLLIGVW